MKRFRPQNIPKSIIIRERLQTGKVYNYNWQTRINWYPANYTYNMRVIARIFGNLHYYACHAPKPVAKKWQKAYNQFKAKHFVTRAGHKTL
jgi:hypothetical protein